MIYVADKKTAGLILGFFAKNPQRNDCTVGVGDPPQGYTFTRDDIPKLEHIAEHGNTYENLEKWREYLNRTNK